MDTEGQPSFLERWLPLILASQFTVPRFPFLCLLQRKRPLELTCPQ